MRPELQNAWFSILNPGYRIPPHKGPTNGIVRIHLGLMVPQQREQCWIRVDDQILHWDEGKCIVFDDSYEHEVQNNTEQQRVVLFFDVIRPMRTPGRILNSIMLALLKRTACFRDAQENIRLWEERNRVQTDQGRLLFCKQSHESGLPNRVSQLLRFLTEWKLMEPASRR